LVRADQSKKIRSIEGAAHKAVAIPITQLFLTTP
jgi:hypothetical protein